MKTSLQLLTLGLLLWFFEAGAAAITVINTNSTGAGSLRQAIVDVPAGGSIDFSITLSGQTIAVTSELVVGKNMTIDASGLPAGLTISGSGARLMSVAASQNVTLRGLTLSGGNGVGATLSGSGGALYNAGVTTLERCTLTGNSAANNGGAIRNGGSLTLTECTLSGNQAADSGGAIVNSAATALVLTHCTISGNGAVNFGGGLMNLGGATTVTNSIVSGNTAPSGADIWSNGTAAALTRVGANLIGVTGRTPDAPDSGPAANTANPLLGPLSNNGGPTKTMALLAYSQAIDAVPVEAVVGTLTVDQRGFARSLGSGPDLGAYESGAGTFNDAGLTLNARVPVGSISDGLVFEISDNASFTVAVPIVATLAGTTRLSATPPAREGVFGFADGSRLSASFDFPSGVAQDSLGNIFIADTANNVVRMMSPDGIVSTIAGTGVYGKANGPGLSAAFAFPSAVAVGPDDNVYVSDTYNHRICKLTRPPTEGAQWTVTTLAGTGTAGFLNGAGSVAKFNYPYGLDLDGAGNVYVADAMNNRIRKVTPGGSVTTFAGSGVMGFSADNTALPDVRFNTPQGLVIFAKAGLPSTIYIADRGNHRVRVISTSSDASGLVATAVATIAGSGVAGFADNSGTAAQFNSPSALTTDSDGNVYIADEQNDRIRRMTPAGVVTTVAGTGATGFLDGLSTVAKFNAPTGLLVARDGTLVVADSENHLIRSIAIGPLRVPATPDPTNINAAGEQVSAILDFAVLGLNPGVRYYFRYRLPDGTTQPLLGQSITKVDLPVVVTGAVDNQTPTAARMKATVDPKGLPTSAVFEYSTDPALLAPYGVATLAGSGVAGFLDSTTSSIAQFHTPAGVAVSGGNVYVADSLNYRIRRVDSTGAVSTFAGGSVGAFINGTGTAARFDRPSGIAVEPDLVISNCANTYGSTAVSCASTAGLVPGAAVRGTNIADGTVIASITDGTHFVLSIPATGTSTGLVLTAGGANFYVADTFNHCIRKITASGQVSTFAGSGVAGYADGAADQAKFLFPTGVALDGAVPPNVYVADSGNHRIRVVAPDGSVTTLAGNGVSGFADGVATGAQFASPQSVAVNAAGEVLVADTGNDLIRVIAGGSVGTFAGSTKGFLDGPSANAMFNTPSGIAVDADDTAYVTDSGNHRIRRIAGGEVTTLAGSGVAGAVNSPAFGLYPATASQFNSPSGIAVDDDGGVVVTQEGLLRKVARGALPTVIWPATLTGAGAQPIVGDISGLLPGASYYYRAKGTCLQAVISGAILSFATPAASMTVSAGASIASAEVLNGQTTPIDFGITPRGTPVARLFTIANSIGTAITVTAINVPAGYQVTSGGGVTAIPSGGTLTFEITLLASSGGTIAGNVVIASDAPGLPTFGFPVTGIVLEPPVVTTLAASGVHSDVATLNGVVNPKGSDTTTWFQWSITGQYDGVLTSLLAGSEPGDAEGIGAAAKFNQPSGLAVDLGGNIYAADTKNHRIRKIARDGTVTTFAGTGVPGFADGPAATAQFNEPIGVIFNDAGTLFVTDSQNHRIRAITPAGEVRTYSGSPLGLPSFTDGVAIAARFSTPSGLAIDASGILYVADRDNHRIRKVATDGSVSTLAGIGTAGSINGVAGVAQFDRPIGIAVDGAGVVYVTEAASHAIRRITPDGTASILAGSPTTAAFINGSGSAARFSNPAGLGLDVTGTLYVADKGNQSIRRITSTTDGSGVVNATVATHAGLGLAGTTNGLKNVARFDSPISLVATGDRELIVGELTHSTLRDLLPTEPLLPVASGLSGTVNLPVHLDVTGLSIGTTYYYRLVATNSRGTSYGNSVSVLAGTPFELWQLANFGPDATNPLIGGDAATPANDGISNRLKYALGLNPFADATGSLPAVVVNGDAITITYTKLLAASDVIYTAEWSSDLIHWNTAGLTEQVSPPIGGTQQVVASIPIAPNRVKFLRLTVTLRQP